MGRWRKMAVQKTHEWRRESVKVLCPKSNFFPKRKSSIPFYVDVCNVESDRKTLDILIYLFCIFISIVMLFEMNPYFSSVFNYYFCENKFYRFHDLNC